MPNKGDPFSPRKFKIEVQELGYGTSKPIASMGKQIDHEDAKVLVDMLNKFMSYREKHGKVEKRIGLVL